MSDINKISVKITGDESGLKQATTEAQKDLNAVSQSAISFGNIVTGTALGSLLGGAITKAFGKFKMMMAEADESFKTSSASLTKLATIMQQRGATQSQYDEIIKLTQAEQKLGIISAEAQQNGLQEMATYVGQAESLKKLTNTMNNLVVQIHGYDTSAYNVMQTATMMGKVLQGQTGGMERIGYHLTEAEKALFNFGTEEERVALLMDIVNNNIGDLNHRLGEVDAGKQMQLANTWSDLKGQVGELAAAVEVMLVPAFSAVANAVATAIGWIKAFLKLFGVKFGTATEVQATNVDNAGDAIDNYGSSVAGAAKKIKRSLAAFDEMNVLTETQSGGGGGGGSSDGVDILEDLEASLDAINWSSLIPDIELPQWIKDLGNIFADLDLDKIGKAFEKFGKQVVKFLEPVGQILSDIWNDYMRPLVTWAGNDLLPAFLSAVGNALELLGNVIGTLWNKYLKPFIDDFLAPIAAWTGGVIVKVLGWISDALGALASNQGAVDAIAKTLQILLETFIAYKSIQAVTGLIDAFGGALTKLRGGAAEITGPMSALLFQVGSAGGNFQMMATGVEAATIKTGGLKTALKGLGDAIFSLDTAKMLGLVAVFEAVKLAMEANKLGEMQLSAAASWYDAAIFDQNETMIQLNDSIQRQVDLKNELQGIEKSLADASIALLNAQDATNNSLETANSVVDEYGISLEEAREKVHNMDLAAGNLSEQDRKLADAILDLESKEGTLAEATQRVTETKDAQTKATEKLESASLEEWGMAKLQEAQMLVNEGRYDELVDKLEEMSQATVEWTDENGKSHKAAEEDVKSMTDFVGTQLTKMGTVNSTVWSAMWDKTGQTTDKMRDKLTELYNSAVASGEDIPAGLAVGVRNGQGGALNALGQLANNVLARFKERLGIQSPSKEFAKAGRWIDAGLAKGVEDDATVAISAAQDLGTAMVDAFNTAPKFRDLGSLDIADQFDDLTARAQGTLQLQNEATNGAIGQLAMAINNLANQGQQITVKIGEETLIDKVVDGINNANMMRNQSVLNL